MIYDIETSSYKGIRNDDNTAWIEEPYAIMYNWQICFNGDVIMGRTWDEWQLFMDRMYNFYGLGDGKKVIFYSHNLGFEWQHTQCFIDGQKDIFAVKPRMPLTIRTDGVEYRCSWKLSNMSLEKFCKNVKDCIYGKAKGDLDYDIWRTPLTPLSSKERMYCASDVKALYHAIIGRMNEEHDTLETIPLTSTGYVRRHVKSYCDADPKYRALFLACKIVPAVYELLREAAGGGDTHANRYLSNKIWWNCDSFDVRSSYPYVMCCKKYPMTQFQYFGKVTSMRKFREAIDNMACIFKVCFTGLQCKSNAIDPILSSSKCKINGTASYDNGRILYAQECITTLTDIDFKELDKYYDWDTIRIGKMYVAKYGYLPKPIRTAIMDLFLEKCNLSAEMEHYDEDSDDYKDLKYLYDKCKNRLNGIFGMMFTDPVRSVIYEDYDTTLKWHEEKISLDNFDRINDALRKFYYSRNSFVNFQWGVWTTSHARAHLHRLLDAGATDATGIYWDTDSLKGFNLNIDAIESENRLIEKEAEIAGAYVDVAGKRYHLGIYEKEKPMRRFITMGAKKYAYESLDGTLHLTVSGVKKEEGAKELGCIENFKKLFKFHKAASKKFYYNDTPERIITIDGEDIRIGASVAMLDNTYTLGLSDDYDKLLAQLGVVDGLY